ncbi:hypothetical protein N665_0019s0045, partial [Sinapis alba]
KRNDMLKTRWGKKKKKTKRVQDITSPKKEVPLTKKTNKVGEEIPKQEKENPIEEEVEENEESEEREEEVNSESGEQEDAADSGEQEDAGDEEEKEDSANEKEEQENAANEEEQENAEMIPENNPCEEKNVIFGRCILMCFLVSFRSRFSFGVLVHHLDWEDEPTGIKPMSMYFPPTRYTKKIKISTRCFITEFTETMDELNPPVTRVEKSWFENHPQFKHIFHMPKDGNHNVMGMWMLLLRTADIEKKNAAWFAVNGSPIRYSIREHALISRLDCRNYPSNYKEAGSMTFVRKYFGNGIIRHQDVKAKLQEMEASRDRLKMMVLYFLSSIINGQRKTGKDAPSVEPFLLRAVGDLNLCKTFPWGRLFFEHMLKEISHTMEHFGGVVKEGVIWPIPGFCIPMEISFAIQNILKASEAEETLLARITELDDIDDIHELVVESWMKMIDKGNVVRFDEMLEEDVAAREAPPTENVGNETSPINEAAENTVKLNEVVEQLLSFKHEVGERMSKIEEKIDEYHVRVTALEDYVQEQVDSMANEMTDHIEKEGGVEKEVVGGGDGNREKVRLKRTKKAANRKKAAKRRYEIVVYVLTYVKT